MPLSNYPGGFNQGLVVRGMPVLTSFAGNVFWVDSVDGSNQNPGTFQRPFKTIDYAIGRCTANNGDYIYVKPGTTETLTAASGIDMDVAGVTVVGLGAGTDVPNIVWGAAAATLEVAVANSRLVNLNLVANFADVAEMIDVAAVAGFEMHNCLVEDTSTILNFLEAVSIADGATYVKLIGNRMIGRSASNDATIQFEGTCRDLEMSQNYIFSTIEQTTTVGLVDSVSELTQAAIIGNVFISSDTTSSAVDGCLVDTSTTTANSGMFAYNMGGVLDETPTSGAEVWDVTGMMMIQNFLCDAVDVSGYVIPAIGDLD